MASKLTVEKLPSGGTLADYYRVSAGTKGGEPCTVKLYHDGRALCLTCLKPEGCIHTTAALHEADGRKE